MIRKTILTAILSVAAFTGCTSTGAPAPGERAMRSSCEVGERRVCTGMTASRIDKGDAVTCACSAIGNVQH